MRPDRGRHPHPVPVGGAMAEVPVPRWLRPPLVRLVLLAVAVLVAEAAVAGITGPFGVDPLGASPTAGLVLGATSAAALLAIYAMVIRVVERRPVPELSLSAAASGLGRGAALGLLLFGLTIGLIALLGGYRVVGRGDPAEALSAIGGMAGVAVIEELLFRGVAFRLVEELTGTWGALAVSAVGFGAFHLGNRDATWWGVLAIAVEAGVLLGAAYVVTRTLWLPIGLHFGWNAAEAGIFGIPTAGSGSDPAGLLVGDFSGPTALSGGAAFGPEASLAAVVVCTTAAVLLLRRAVVTGRLRRRRPGGPPRR